MCGIRVASVPHGCTEKDIRIHFSNPYNGGGKIKAIYYPLFKGDAVVMFEDDEIAQRVDACEHQLRNQPVSLEHLPSVQVFRTLDAQLESTTAAFLQASDDVREDIEYCMNVEILRDNDGSITGVRGNWYLLEWFWVHIQKVIDQHPKETNHRHSLSDGAGHSQSPASQIKTDQKSPFEMEICITSLPSILDIKNRLAFEAEEIGSDEWKPPRATLHKRSKKDTPRSASSAAFSVSDLNKCSSDIQQQLSDESGGMYIENLEDLSKHSVNQKNSDFNKIVILHDNLDDPRTLDFKYGLLTISIYTGFITMAETDAIVNAVMGPLINAGGVAGAIANAAHPDMQQQCDEYVDKYGSVPTAGVMHTCAGGKISSNVKYVIHTVGPVWSGFLEDKCRMELTLSFLNSMKYGNDVLKIKSISMPVISSGIFGCPLEMCVRSFFNAVLLFSSDHAGDSVTLRELHLINNNSDSTVMTVLHLRGLIGQDPESLVAQAKQEISQNVKDLGYGSAGSLSTERIQRLTTDAVSSTRYDSDIQSTYLRSRQLSDSGIPSTPMSPARVSDYTDSKFKSSPGSNPSKSGMRNLAYSASVSPTGLSNRSARCGNISYSTANYKVELDRDYYSPSASGHHSLDSLRLDTPTSPLITGYTGKARSPGPPSIGLQSISMGLPPGGDIRRTMSPVSPVTSVYQPSHLHISSGFSGNVHKYEDGAYGLNKNISTREPRTLDRPLPAVPKTAKWT